MQKPFYEKPRFKLYQADCLELLNSLPENSVDMIFADPPYFLSSGSFTCQNGKMVSVKKGDWDLTNGTKKNFEFHNEWIKACRRVLKPNGTIWISGTYHSIYQCGFALEINKYHFLNDIAWFKPNASPNLSCRFFTASHETLLWARKEKKGKHTFNYDLMKNGDWPEDQMKKPGLQMRSVWSINTPKPIEKKFGKHPTQKSLAELSVNRYLFLDRLNEAINSVLEAYAKKRFVEFVAKKKIATKAFENFPETITLKEQIPQEFNKNYYEKIDKLNKEELSFVERLDLDSLPNVEFWVRNREKQDPFFIQGWKKGKFYPDFVALTKKGNIVALEWKGEDRISNEDTGYKVEIADEWIKLGKGKLHFFLVHNGNVEEILKDLTAL